MGCLHLKKKELEFLEALWITRPKKQRHNSEKLSERFGKSFFKVKRKEKFMTKVQPVNTTPPQLGWCHHTKSISTGKSVQCNQETQQQHLQLDGVTIHTAYLLANQYSATSRQNNTTSTWMVSNYTHHIYWQLSTVQPAVQPADITPPPTLWWWHHTQTISTGKAIQCNQQTQQHHLNLDSVTKHTSYQLATQYTATRRHNSTISTWMVSTYTQHINWRLSTVKSADISTPPPRGLCQHK